jgi:hypothetical protein
VLGNILGNFFCKIVRSNWPAVQMQQIRLQQQQLQMVRQLLAAAAAANGERDPNPRSFVTTPAL